VAEASRPNTTLLCPHVWDDGGPLGVLDPPPPDALPNISLVVADGASVNAPDGRCFNFTPLHYAAKLGNETVRAPSSLSAPSRTCKEQHGGCGCCGSSTGIVGRCQGASIAPCTQCHCANPPAPLHTCPPCTQVVAALVALGADVGAVSDNGGTALHYAAVRNQARLGGGVVDGGWEFKGRAGA
jgi:ankyrin repeat protein